MENVYEYILHKYIHIYIYENVCNFSDGLLIRAQEQKRNVLCDIVVT